MSDVRRNISRKTRRPGLHYSGSITQYYRLTRTHNYLWNALHLEITIPDPEISGYWPILSPENSGNGIPHNLPLTAVS